MSPNDIAKELVGTFCIHRPSKDGVWFDPEDGTTGLIAAEDGFTLVRGFAQTIYPPRGSGNINGTVTDEARYYDGFWYKGYREDGSIWYLLKGFKRSIKVMEFANSSWIGNSTIEYDRSNSGIILQLNPDGVWYYRCKMGDFPFIRAAQDSPIDKVEEAKTLNKSGLAVEEWVLGLWKAEVTKMDRKEELESYDEYTQKELDDILKSYGEKKTFYLEITKDYIKYKFPLPLHSNGDKLETCNDFSIQHSYTIKENQYNGYEIFVGEVPLASISKFNTELYLTVSHISLFSVALHRVNDLGTIEEDVYTEIPDNSISQEDDTNRFITNATRYWKNISWVYGEWQIPDNHPSEKVYAVRITPFYYQETAVDTDSTINFSELPKKRYKAMKGDDSILGSVVYIDKLYLDLTSKHLYQLYADKTIYLEQTSVEKFTLYKVVFWIIAIIIGIGILWGLLKILKILIRLMMLVYSLILSTIKNVCKVIYNITHTIAFKRILLITFCALSIWGLCQMCDGDDGSHHSSRESAKDEYKKCAMCGNTFKSSQLFHKKISEYSYGDVCSDCSFKLQQRQRIKEGRNKWVDENPQEARRRGIKKF